MDITNRNYEKFDGKERFKLVLSAVARNDDVEMQKLFDTCPSYSYRVSDMHFRERINSIIMIGDVFFRFCVCLYADIEKFNNFVYDSREENEYVLEHKIETKLTDEKLLEKIEVGRDIRIAQLKAFYLAFDDFCKEIEINSKDILKDLPIKQACGSIDHWLSLEINTDEDYRKATKEMFLECWGFK